MFASQFFVQLCNQPQIVKGAAHAAFLQVSWHRKRQLCFKQWCHIGSAISTNATYASTYFSLHMLFKLSKKYSQVNEICSLTQLTVKSIGPVDCLSLFWLDNLG